jgi:hypothetical protein
MGAPRAAGGGPCSRWNAGAGAAVPLSLSTPLRAGWPHRYQLPETVDIRDSHQLAATVARIGIDWEGAFAESAPERRFAHAEPLRSDGHRDEVCRFGHQACSLKIKKAARNALMRIVLRGSMAYRGSKARFAAFAADSIVTMTWARASFRRLFRPRSLAETMGVMALDAIG